MILASTTVSIGSAITIGEGDVQGAYCKLNALNAYLEQSNAYA